MKVESFQPLWYNVSATKPNTSQRRKLSCRKLYTLFARNATTIKSFIVMAKISMDFKNIFAVNATTSLHRSARERGKMVVVAVVRERGHIRFVQNAKKQASCTMIIKITATSAAVTNAAITHLLPGKIPLFFPLQ